MNSINIEVDIRFQKARTVHDLQIFPVPHIPIYVLSLSIKLDYYYTPGLVSLRNYFGEEVHLCVQVFGKK